MNDNTRPTNTMLVIGAVIFVTVTGAWLFAEFNHIGTGALLAFAVPVVSALFLGHQLGQTATAAQQAANQTNGMMESRVESAVASALAKRDAARTRQVMGDIGVDQAAASTAARKESTETLT